MMATSVRLDKNLEERLDRLARETGRTKAYYIREMIADSIDDAEAYYLARDVLERIHKGQESTHSLAEVKKSLGLDH